MSAAKTTNFSQSSIFGSPSSIKALGSGLILAGILCSFLAAAIFSEKIAVDWNPASGGFLMLVLGMATLIQGLSLLTREGRVQSFVLVSIVALLLQTFLLSIYFFWPLLIVFLLSALGLYLSTEWNAITLGEKTTSPKISKAQANDDNTKDDNTNSPEKPEIDDSIESELDLPPSDTPQQTPVEKQATDELTKASTSNEEINQALLKEIKKLRQEVKHLRADANQQSLDQITPIYKENPNTKSNFQTKLKTLNQRNKYKQENKSPRLIDSIVGIFVIFIVLYITLSILF